MRRKLIFMVLIVLALGVGSFYLLFQNNVGSVVLYSDVFPYQAQFVSESEVLSFECAATECSYSLNIGKWDYFIDKEGYYVIQDSFYIAGGNDVYDVTVELETIPGLIESEIDTSSVDESLFEVCYGNNDECGLTNLFFMEKDLATGYMTLWEGEVRRGTFTKGMNESLMFIQPDFNGAILYDLVSFDAYAVNFLEDTRSYLFTLEDLEGVMFIDDGYIIDAGSLYWLKDNTLNMLPFNWGLSQITYADGRIYFLAAADELGDSVSAEGVLVGSYDGDSVYVIADNLEIDIATSVIASDESSVYVKNGDEIFELRQ